MSEPRTPRWASSYELGEYLGLHQKTINKLTRSGRLVAYRLGTNFRYDLNEVDAGIRSAPVSAMHEEVRQQGGRDALATVRTRIPTDRSLIPVTRVLDIIDAVTAEVGTEQPTSTPNRTPSVGATHAG